MTGFSDADGIKFSDAGNALDSEWRAAPGPESDVDMSDLYHRHADAIADDLLADPDLFDDVSAEFASNSDKDYGEWMPGGEDGGDGSGGADEYDAAYPGYGDEDRHHRNLSADEQSDLDELNRVMAGAPEQSLLSGTGRGAYVHSDDDDIVCERVIARHRTLPPSVPSNGLRSVARARPSNRTPGSAPS